VAGHVDCELVIVGGGPAGLTTALFLVAAAPRLKGRICVVERGRYPREKICAGAMGSRADRALARIGVFVMTAAGDLVARHRTTIGRVVRRNELDRALSDLARARGIRILEGTTVRSIARGTAGCTVDLGSEGSMRVSAVVGADGVGSVVRRSLGLGHGELIAQAAEVDTAPTSSDRRDELLHFDVSDRSLRGYVWDFPTIVGGKHLVCRGIYELLPRRIASASARAQRPDIGARLAKALEARHIDADPRRFKRFAERGLSLHEPTARPRALLVGEAAGIDPILGEGIAQAILYGQTAGPYLARCLELGRFDFSDWPTVFSRSRVGLDLAIRSRLAPWVYDRRRPLAERFVSTCHPFAEAGMHYFAGDRVPRLALARSGLALARLATGWGPRS
jgi:menaquinone-9 beta-reductase